MRCKQLPRTFCSRLFFKSKFQIQKPKSKNQNPKTKDLVLKIPIAYDTKAPVQNIMGVSEAACLCGLKKMFHKDQGKMSGNSVPTVTTSNSR